MLADDPHLSLATPSIWYQSTLEMKDLNVSGVIFAGVPGVILGHNDKIAWGVTNTGPDVQDLYIEKRNPNNENEFLYNDKWEKATVVDESIKVKGGKTIPYNVTVTSKTVQSFQSLRIKESENENSICFKVDCFGAFR